ncbi:CotH kinase family protein [uncultured Clostridium sp.]|uniref:CotH kinase family protein n=1 Tax=uncultured Clostridium sp. TaxID=59620 RepID=UPI0028EE15CF|nr:CotH kinase family protein [uncultured Clostridium sp.]
MKKNFKIYTICFVLFCTILAISKFIPNFGEDTLTKLKANIETGLTQEEKDAKVESEIFSKDKVVDLNITINEEDFQNMKDNAMKEEFKVASVNYNGYEFDNVGIRTKGNSSLSQVAGSDSDRYSFKIDFEKYIDNQNFYGITKINLNNCISDASYMREFLTYEMMEEMGVPTPRYSYVNIYINGELWGLYLAVEQVNESFINSNFEITNGNLYKPDGSGSDLVWKGEDGDYSGISLKTNKKENDNSKLHTMMQALNEGKDLDKYLNIDEILKYLAVSTVTSNFDSYQGSMKHNYYLYEENGVFSILPWDFNMSFAGFSNGAGNDQMITNLIDEPTMGKLSDRPLIAKLLEVPEYKEKYHEYIKELVEGYLSKENFSNKINELSNLISSYVEKDPTKFYTFEEFQKAISEEESKDNQVSTDKSTSIDKSVPVGEQKSTDKSAVVDDSKSADGKKAVDDKSGANKKGMMGMMGGSVQLQPFVEKRVENVKKQLSGEIPSYDEGNGMGIQDMGGPRGAGGQKDKIGAQGDGDNKMEAPDGMQKEDLPQDFDLNNIPNDGQMPQGNGQRPDGQQMPGNPPNMGGGNKFPQDRGNNVNTTDLIINGVGLGVMLITVAVISIRRRTRI